MGTGDKKQRHKAKREAKRREMRRKNAVSPLRRLAESPGELECWMSDDFQGFGQSQMFVFKRAAGLKGVACFLVDRGVVGLKDAWTRIGVARTAFQEMMDASAERGIVMNRVDVAEIRRRVAGGVRWASDNGMRLPREWTKAASLIDGVGAWESADVSLFEREFIGHPEDLRQRLVHEPFESYIQRSDVHFEFADEAPYLDQETGDYVEPDEDDDELDDDKLDDDELKWLEDAVPLEELKRVFDRLSLAAAALAGGTASWLATQSQAPSPELLEAWQSLMLARLISATALPGLAEDEANNMMRDVLAGLGGRLGEGRILEHDRAIAQAMDHLLTDPTMVRRAIREHAVADAPAETSAIKWPLLGTGE